MNEGIKVLHETRIIAHWIQEDYKGGCCNSKMSATMTMQKTNNK
jgi:hypothetical protein